MIPEHTLQALDDYIISGLEPGGFLTAVLSNDLKGAVTHADRWNQNNLADTVKFIANCAPASCWGSREQMTKWLDDFRKGVPMGPAIRRYKERKRWYLAQ
jgi:hypothetical protein